jgi:hypothetical protein
MIPIIAMWVLCAILALGTILKTRRAGLKGMALNPLTLIFLYIEDNHVEETSRAAVPSWHSKEEAQKRANELQVQLKISEKKVSFVRGRENKSD